MKPTRVPVHPRPLRENLRTARSIASHLTLLTMLLTGCSVFMAAKQPDKKDLGLMTEGTPRAVLIEEFGAPVGIKEVEGRKAEVFSFLQGYSDGNKASRAIFHGTADVLTLGLWEIVGTPTEAIYSGRKLYYQVTYDENDRVVSAVALKE